MYDNNVTAKEKRKAIVALNSEIKEEIENRYNIGLQQAPEILCKGLEFFVNVNSKEFFKRFTINTDFLKSDPLIWQFDESCNKTSKCIQNLPVVNDVTEREV